MEDNHISYSSISLNLDFVLVIASLQNMCSKIHLGAIEEVFVNNLCFVSYILSYIDQCKLYLELIFFIQ